MNNEVELISDGDGLAVIGDPRVVELFLSSAGLPSRDLSLVRATSALRTGGLVAKAGAEVASSSGRWVQLSKESAELMSKLPLMAGSNANVGRAILTDNGKITNILEIVRQPGILSLATSPAMLTGVAGIMAQLAMQEAMDEITEYLAVIDAKVDDILRAQKDAALAEMIGAGFVIDDAITLREHTGKVSEVTWSKVQGTPQTVARTQAYALRQLDAIAEKLEKKSSMADLARTSREAERQAEEWVSVLARCFQLQDALAVLELDRILDSSPDDLDRHRIGLRAGRQSRLGLITRTTEQLLARMDAAAGRANSKVLLHPIDARSVVVSSNHVASGIVVFHRVLGVDRERESLEAKKWTVAAVEARDRAIETGAVGVDAAARFGNETIDRARSATDKIAIKLAERALKRRENGDQTGEDV